MTSWFAVFTCIQMIGRTYMLRVREPFNFSRLTFHFSSIVLPDFIRNFAGTNKQV